MEHACILWCTRASGVHHTDNIDMLSCEYQDCQPVEYWYRYHGLADHGRLACEHVCDVRSVRVRTRVPVTLVPHPTATGIRYAYEYTMTSGAALETIGCVLHTSMCMHGPIFFCRHTGTQCPDA